MRIKEVSHYRAETKMGWRFFIIPLNCKVTMISLRMSYWQDSKKTCHIHCIFLISDCFYTWWFPYYLLLLVLLIALYLSQNNNNNNNININSSRKKNILKTQAYKLAFWWLNICGTIYVQTKFAKEKNSS